VTEHQSYRFTASADDPTTELVAELVVAAAARQLGMKTPRIRWFRHDPEPAVTPGWWAGGFTDGVKNLWGTVRHGDQAHIYLHAGLSQGDAARTAAHEVRHQFQHHGPDRPPAMSADERERDATSWAIAWHRAWSKKGIRS
jgi:hypothetical protein